MEGNQKQPPPRPKRCPNCGGSRFTIYDDFIKCGKCGRTLLVKVTTEAWMKKTDYFPPETAR